MSSHARIAKLLVDTGDARDIESATRAMAATQLQLVLGTDVAKSETLQLTALLASDLGRRAFPAGVVVVLESDGEDLTGWRASPTLAQSLVQLGARLQVEIDVELPTILVGNVNPPTAPRLGVRAVPRGWAGGSVAAHLPAPAFQAGTLGAVIAASSSVSELFCAIHRVNLRASRRSVGLSTWDSGASWDTDAAVGPTLEHLPADVWLLGLGHLGQAYAWLLRALPYRDPSDAHLGLHDFDQVDRENFATQLLTAGADVGARKTRVVMQALECSGFRTTLVERPFDAQHRRQTNETATALIGLHDDATRRLLSDAGWRQIVNVGLGAHADSFTQILLQRVGTADAATLFAEHPGQDDRAARLLEEVSSYRELAESDQCGAVIAAGKAVGTAFVGAMAAAMAVAELLRPLHGGGTHVNWQANVRTLGDATGTTRPWDARDVPADYCSARGLREKGAP